MLEEQLKKKAGNDTTKLEAIKNGFRLCTQDYIKQELGIEKPSDGTPRVFRCCSLWNSIIFLPTGIIAYAI